MGNRKLSPAQKESEGLPEQGGVLINKTNITIAGQTAVEACFAIDLSAKGVATIEIFDTLGKRVFYMRSDKPVVVLNDHQMKPGIYLLRLKNKRKNIFIRKLVINR